MSNNEKLLKCPCCGGENIIETWNNLSPVLLCGDCGLMMTIPMSFKGSYKIELMRKWNTRKPVDDVVEALEEKRKLYMMLWREMGDARQAQSVGDYITAIEIVKEHLT